MPSAQSTLSSIGGYTILSLSLPPLPSFPTPASHYLYLAPHEPKVPTPTAARSLFLINVPLDATEAHIKHLFSTQLGLSHGRIEDVHFEADRRQGLTEDGVVPKPDSNERKGKKRKRALNIGPIEEEEGASLPPTWDRKLQRNGGTATVLFVDRASMEAVLKEARKKRKSGNDITWGEGVEAKLPKLGSLRYLKHHTLCYPDKSALLQSVNTFMTAFAEREASEARAQVRRRQQPDEDGFITVTKGGRIGSARQEVAQEMANKQKEKQKGLHDFYRFQMRERQKAKSGELVRKFEEDKQKVRKMQERTGAFRPE